MRGSTEALTAWGFLAPTLALLALLAVYPLGHAVYLSTTTAQVGVPGRFVGAQNFVRPLETEIFPLTLWNTVWYTLAAVSAKLGLVLALVLAQRAPGMKWIRGAVLVPWVAPALLSVLAWTWMFARGPAGQPADDPQGVPGPLDDVVVDIVKRHAVQSVSRANSFKQVGEKAPAIRDDLLRAATKLEKIDHPVGVRKLHAQMEPTVLSWDDGGNNKYMLSGRGAWTINAPSIYLKAKKEKMPFADAVEQSPPPAGPKGRFYCADIHGWGIFKFSPNVELAKNCLRHMFTEESQNLFLTLGQGYDAPALPKFDVKPPYAADPQLRGLVGYMPNMFAKAVQGASNKDAVAFAVKALTDVGYAK